MGTHSIGVNRAVPCVGSPDGQIYACGADGELSLVALADLNWINGAQGRPEPVIVHITVCRAHLREVRSWLRRMTPEQIDVWPTAGLLDHWGIFEEQMPDVPVWRLQHAG